MDGKKFQWLIVGMYQDRWWEKNVEDTTCTAAEIQKALIGTMVLDILPLASNEDITISRRVRSLFLKRIHSFIFLFRSFTIGIANKYFPNFK